MIGYVVQPTQVSPPFGLKTVMAGAIVNVALLTSFTLKLVLLLALTKHCPLAMLGTVQPYEPLLLVALVIVVQLVPLFVEYSSFTVVKKLAAFQVM